MCTCVSMYGCVCVCVCVCVCGCGCVWVCVGVCGCVGVLNIIWAKRIHNYSLINTDKMNTSVSRTGSKSGG